MGRLNFRFSIALVFTALAFPLAHRGAEPPATPELERVGAWLIDGPKHFQPSALLLRPDGLWTVSDKDHSAIYRLEPGDGIAKAVRSLEVIYPDTVLAGKWLDLEALAAAPDGGFLVASEELQRLIRIDPSGKASVAALDLASMGGLAGLFATRNAGIEAMAVLADGTIIFGAEREPRGLIEVTGDPPTRVAIQRFDESIYPIPEGRRPDFADLTVWRGRLFALARNQHLVVELVRTAGGSWREADAWSYAATENDPAYRYRDRRYGLAEGLAIDDERIFLVFDNNDDPRESDPADVRPVLFAFRNSIPLP